MGNTTRVTIIRLSAMGDVVLLLPVVRALRMQHPEVALTVVSQPFAAPLFGSFPGVRFVAADVRGRHRGVRGMWRLAGDLLRGGAVGRVADMHGALRARLLLLFLRIRSLPCWFRSARIDKGRRGKRALTRQHGKSLQPQQHSVQRYAEVLGALGCAVHVPYARGGWHAEETAGAGGGSKPASALRVGIAPFAKHQGKIYPLDSSLRVARLLAEAGCQLYFFAGPQERELLMRWAEQIVGSVVVPSLALDLAGELDLMRELDVCLSMDSANMHLASWAGVPVVSIWGATHPYAGFGGWGQPAENALQRNDLACRPCSVFGNKVCLRGDYACMDMPPEMVAQRVLLLARGENPGSSI